MKEILLRIKLEAPLFFKRLLRVSLAVAAAGIVIIQAVPSLNIVMFVLNKGTDYQDVIRLMPVLIAYTTGMASAAILPVNDKNKQILKQELAKEAI